MPARLAVVVDTFPLWSERFIARELNELLRRGVDFTIFCLNAGVQRGPDPEWDALTGSVCVLPRLVSAKTVAATLCALPALHRKETRRRLQVVARALGPSSIVRCARGHALGAQLRAGAFTAVHAHFANWPSTIAWLAAHDANLPLTVSVHARDLFVEAQLLEEKARDARAIFACSQLAARHVAGIGPARGKVIYMTHGLPLDLYPFHELPARDPLRPELLAAGRFVAKKGFGELLAALEAPPLRGRTLTLTLVGDGPERVRLDQRIAQLGLSSCVQVRPPVPSAQLREWIANAAVFIAPYRQTDEGDRDGIPNAVLEAFALGTPVVGTAAGGLPEVLGAETGFVTPDASAAALAETIAQALDDRTAAARRAATARKLVEEHHDIRHCIEPLLNVLNT